MARIKVDIDTLRNHSRTIEQHISEYEELNARMKNISQSVTATWQGEASNAYVSLMDSYGLRARQFADVLKEFYNYSKQASTMFDEVDRNSAAQIRKSF